MKYKLIMPCFIVLLAACSSKKELNYVNKDSYGVFVQRSAAIYYYMTNTQKKCNGEGPLFNCVGIMASAFEKGNDWTIPYKEKSSSNKLSFSYWSFNIRKLHSKPYTGGVYGSSGIMLWPNEELADDGSAMTVNYTCSYPQNAATGTKLGEANGCNQLPSKDIACQDLGIFTLQQYLDHFGYDSSGAAPQFIKCGNALGRSSSGDETAFNTTLQEEEYMLQKNDDFNYDETVMKKWDEDAPEKIPLMGFFVIDEKLFGVPGYSPASPVQQQLDYYTKSGVFAPIIRVSGTGWDEAKFTYLPEDQSESIPKMVRVFNGLAEPFEGQASH